MISRNNAFKLAFKAVQESSGPASINPRRRYKGRSSLESELSAIVVNAMKIAEEKNLDLAGAVIDRMG